jgi:energy-coupling factor transporter ATP-binding protein EcfA2
VQKLQIKLENCYGIRKLEADFDFTKKNIVLIYAPNGSMKTSFANTFQALSDGTEPVDRVHADRKTRWTIKDEAGDLESAKIFVIVPMNEGYRSDRISTLLVNKKLKVEYEAIRETLDAKKESLVASLQALSGLAKKDVAPEFAAHFANDPKKFFEALERVPPDVFKKKKSGFGSVSYKTIFNDKVLTLIQAPDFQKKLAEYMENYNELISKSRFFKQGVFNHDNATTVASNLADNGFFEAQHSINMKAKTGTQVIGTEEELIQLIQEEKDKILTDAKLMKAFDSLNTKMAKNQEARSFRVLLETNKSIITELANLRRLKDKMWTDYLIESSESFNAILVEYKSAKEKIDDIFRRAREEKTKWRKVIEEFNRRFTVPFTVEMENQEDVIVKEEAPSLKFNHTGAAIDEQTLWGLLSMGERRALYLLNIIFEVHGRRESGQETLFVIDDIADSFDYKNKYAIIEYLKDISEEKQFSQIIMSHNFDFYRSVSSRLGVPREHKFHTSKSAFATRLVVEKYQRNPFRHWRANLNNDEMLVASIPFVRNLAEYCGDQANFDKLTRILHIKPDTGSIVVADLEKVFKDVLRDQEALTLKEPKRRVKDLIYDLAEGICRERTEVIELEKKIVLSIAIRLRAEDFLIKELNDDDFLKGITENQTMALFEKYKKTNPAEIKSLEVLGQVMLMTPENIHLNSFMYEPILDMANDHLKNLHAEVLALFKK